MNIVDVLVNLPFVILFFASLIVNVYLWGRLQGLETSLTALRTKRTR